MPHIICMPSGGVIKVGKNAYENDMLSFQEALPDDLWFHVDGCPGSHVILQNKYGRYEKQSAANWAAFHSKARFEKHVQVVYARISQIYKHPKDPPGMVRFKGLYDTMIAYPSQKQIFDLRDASQGDT